MIIDEKIHRIECKLILINTYNTHKLRTKDLYCYRLSNQTQPTNFYSYNYAKNNFIDQYILWTRFKTSFPKWFKVRIL